MLNEIKSNFERLIALYEAQRKLAARDEGEKQLLDEMTSYLDSIDRK